MKKLRIKELAEVRSGHFLQHLLPGHRLNKGGMSFMKPGMRSHSHNGPGGEDIHVHTDHEGFLILQGTGTLELNKQFYPVTTGDIIVVEPGEDHHLISSETDPLVVVWCHAGSGGEEDERI